MIEATLTGVELVGDHVAFTVPKASFGETVSETTEKQMVGRKHHAADAEEKVVTAHLMLHNEGAL